jgi:hypothetical protein
MERNEEDNVYQEEIEEHENFTVSRGARLIELATRDVELMEEEQGPLKNLFKNYMVLQRKVFGNHNEWLKDVKNWMHVSPKQILMLLTFDK